jgi:hypothetical protein
MPLDSPYTCQWLSLRSIAFKEDYRSGRDGALKDFSLPAFKVARRYDRAVGYLSSSALECFAEPLGQFVQFGGTIRLVTSVELRDEDAAVIEPGRSAAELCEERVLEVVSREFGPGAVSTGVRKLGALLEAGRLEIKIATLERGRGIYHEKVGIFHDGGEDYVAFSGSTNESREALLHNYECIDVYPSWEATSRARGKLFTSKRSGPAWRRVPGPTPFRKRLSGSLSGRSRRRRYVAERRTPATTKVSGRTSMQ